MIIIHLLLRIIEEVIFKSCPTPLGKKQRAAPTDMKVNDRVEKIINDLFEFGVSIEVLFDVDDLVKAKNIPKVRCRCFPAVIDLSFTNNLPLYKTLTVFDSHFLLCLH